MGLATSLNPLTTVIGTGAQSSSARHVVSSADNLPTTTQAHGSDSPSHLAAELNRRTVRVLKEREVQSARNVQLLQLWEGYVTAIDNDEVTAILRDKSDPMADDEEITFSIGEVADEDRPLVSLGAVFYLSIFFEEWQGQPRRRVTSLRFRRLQPWTTSDLCKAKNSIQHLRSFFK